MRLLVLLFAFVAACGGTGPSGVPAPPPPGALTLAVGPIQAGGSVGLTVHGAPVGQAVHFLVGGPGPGDCPPVLGGACLGISGHQVLGRAVADAAGVAVLTLVAPPRLPDGRTAWFQAGFPVPGGAVITPPVARTSGLADADLLLTEVVVTPTGGEAIEVHNPGSAPVDLSRVWLADHAGAVQLPLGGGLPVSSDFTVRFPDGAVLAPGGHVVVAIGSATHHASAHGRLPDYDLAPSDSGAPDMVGAWTASSGLTNGDEIVWLFQWDGASDRLIDLDYLVYGDTSDALDRTGLVVGTHAYGDDTPAALQRPAPTHGGGASLQRCDRVEDGQGAGGNGLGGVDETSEDLAATWAARTALTLGGPSDCARLPLDLWPVNGFAPPAFGFPSAAGTWVFDSASAFEGFFGQPAPSIDWSVNQLVYHSLGPQPYPATVPVITGVTLVGPVLEVAVDVSTPGAGCTILDYAPVAWALVVAERPPVAAAAVSAVSAVRPFDCGADGVEEGWECTATELCATGALCHALTVWDFGFCREATDHGRFYQPAGGAVPDDGSALSSTLTASGLTTVPEDVILTVALTHPEPGQLTLTLVNPIGTPFVVLDRPVAVGGLSFTMPVGFAGDEPVNGTWTLEVVDHVPGGSGTLLSWDLELTSRYD